MAVGGASAAKPSPTAAFTDFTVAATPPNPAGTICPGSALCSNGAAEPAIGVAPTGRFYASSENGLGGGTLAWTSSDNGLHYASTPSPNDVSTGSDSVGQESGFEPGGGDTDVAVATATNSAGNYNAYVVSLTLASIDVSTSTNNGATWSLNPAAALPSDDRPWVAATGASKVCISYLTAPGILLPQVGLHVQCRSDAGSSFPQVANAYDTSAVGPAASQGGSRTGNLVFDPVNVAVDRGGAVYIAYSDNHGVSYQYSTNHGQTFSAPVQVSQGTDTAVMPWLAAGDAGKVDLVYYQAVGYSGNPEVAPSSVAWKVVMAQSIEASPTTGLASIIYSDDQYQNDANHKPDPVYNCTGADTDTSTCNHTNVATQTSGNGIFKKGK